MTLRTEWGRRPLKSRDTILGAIDHSCRRAQTDKHFPVYNTRQECTACNGQCDLFLIELG